MVMQIGHYYAIYERVREHKLAKIILDARLSVCCSYTQRMYGYASDDYNSENEITLEQYSDVQWE